MAFRVLELGFRAQGLRALVMVLRRNAGLEPFWDGSACGFNTGFCKGLQGFMTVYGHSAWFWSSAVRRLGVIGEVPVEFVDCISFFRFWEFRIWGLTILARCLALVIVDECNPAIVKSCFWPLRSATGLEGCVCVFSADPQPRNLKS